MGGGSEIAAERKLGGGNVRVRHGDLQVDEDAMVPAPILLLADPKAGALDQARRLPCDIGRAGRVPAQGIGVLGKAAIIEKEVRPLAAVAGEAGLLPMTGNRSEERRGGKECVSTWRSRWSPDP